MPLMRSSERSTFMRCPQQWYWGYVEGLQPLNEKKNAADWGTLFHVALAEYYLPGLNRGPHPADTWDKLAKQHITVIKTEELRDDELITTWEDFHALGIELAEAYVERYKGDPHWDVLDAERRFAVNIPDVRYPPRHEDGKRGFVPICTLVGTIDLVVRDLNDGLVKMVDHKSAARILTHHLTLDTQASTYIAVGTNTLRSQGLIGPKEVIKGMEYNFIKRAKIDHRPRDDDGKARNKPQKKHYIAAIEAHSPGCYDEKDLLKLKIDELAFEAECTLGITNVYGEVSADQTSDNFLRTFVPRTYKERQRQIVRISQEAAVMAAVGSGELPILKNTTKECNWCPYFDLCELDEAGEDTEYYKSTMYKKRDPYQDHRPDAEASKKLRDDGTMVSENG